MALVEAMVRRHRGGSRIGAWITCVVAVAIAWAALAGCRGVVAESLPVSPTASPPESPPQSPPESMPESPPAGGGGADLLIVAIMAGDRNPAAGGSFVLSVIVGNDGTAAAPATRVRFLRSADEEITTDDSEVGTVELAPIAVAGRASGSVEVSAPATGGTYYYGACVEAVTGESDTGNNCSAAVAVVVAASGEPGQPAGPASSGADLTVAAPMASDANPVAGASFTLSATVVNGGTGSSNATEVRFFRSTDATITVADTQVAVADVPALAASGSVTASADVSAPAAGGTYYYGACVDAVPGEAATGNNCSPAVTVRALLPGAPDLRIGSTEVQGHNIEELSVVYVNREIAVRVDVRNAGGGVSSGTTLRLYVSTSPDVPASDRTEALTVAVPQLVAPGNFNTNTRYLNAPGTGGTYYYRACVDAVADESDTTNNCGDAVALQVYADAPNFVVGLTTGEITVIAGSTFTLEVVVMNWGLISPDTATLRYYRSADDTISPDDTELGTAVVPELRFGATNHRRYSLQVSAPGTSGTYYYGACMDAATNEAITTENCSPAMSVTVQS